MNYYYQALSSLEQQQKPKSRHQVLSFYFQKYLPSFSITSPMTLQAFIEGSTSYEVCLKQLSQIRDERRREKVRSHVIALIHLGGDIRTASPEDLLGNLDIELRRFREAFGPRKVVLKDRIPGTMTAPTRSVMDSGAW